MGNACCSEGGQNVDQEYQNYQSRPKTHDNFAKDDKNMLLAYQSGEKQKVLYN